MKRIQKARIKFITLCPRGKNLMPVLYKADGTVEFDTIIKASEDAGEITAIVYPAERADTDDHVASAEVIKDMAHAFQKEGGQIDIRHDGKAVDKDQAYVAESFIVQKGDPRFVDSKDYDGNPVDATDAWATVIKIDDPQLRQLYKDGEWNGVSMQGRGLMSVEKSDDSAPGLFRKFLTAVGLGTLLTTNDEDVDMNQEELKAILKENREVLVTELAKAMKPEDKNAGKPGEIVKEGGRPPIDLTNAEAVRELADKLEKEKAVDLTDPKVVRALADKLEKEAAEKALDLTDPKIVRELADKLAKEEADAIEKAEADDTEEVKALKSDLRKAEIKAGTNQLEGNENKDVPEGFTKEDVEAMDIGSRMAAFNNKQRGYTVSA